MNSDELHRLPGESSAEWVERVTRILRTLFSELDDPQERKAAAAHFARAMEVPYAVAWVYLTRTEGRDRDDS